MLDHLEQSELVGGGPRMTPPASPEDPFRALVESLDDCGLFLLDSQGRVLTWNLGAERITRFPSREIVGSGHSRLYLEQEVTAGAPARELAEAAAAGKLEREGWRRRADGSRFWAQVILTALKQGEGLSGFACLVRDLTAPREAARLVWEASRALTTSLDPEHLISTVARLAVPWLADWCSVQLVDGGAGGHLAVAHVDPAKVELAVELSRTFAAGGGEQRWFDQVLRSGEPRIFSAPRAEAGAGATSTSATLEEQQRLFAELDLDSAMAVPIRGRDRILGVICCFAVSSGRSYGPAELEVAEQLAARAGLAIENALLFAREQATRARLDAVIAASPAPILLMDLEGIVRLWNPAAQRVFGWTAPEVMGKPLPSVLPEDWTELLDVLSRVGSGERVFNVEARRVTKRRGEIDVMLSIAPVTDPDGRTYCLSVVVDVTDRRRAEQQLRASAGAHRFLAQTSAELSGALAQETALDRVAALAVPELADWCLVFACAEDGTLRQAGAAHQDPEKLERVRELGARYPIAPASAHPMNAVLRSGKPLVLPEIEEGQLIAAAGGDQEHLRALKNLGMRSGVALPMFARGRALGVLVLAMDRSGRRFTEGDRERWIAEEFARRVGMYLDNARLLQDAQAAVRRRDDFLSVASHELKTPVTSLQLQIQGLLRMIDRTGGALPPEQLVSRLGKADVQVHRLTDLIEELLDASRVAAGRFTINPAPLELDELVREVTGRLEDQAASRGSALSLQLAPGVRGSWDRERIDQLVTNLLENAIKYGAGGPVAVRLGMDGERAVLEVEDRGVGISREDQGRIFEQFERASSARKFSGLGLGLWISKQIVVAHDGSIEVRSAPGEGSTFTVSLPLSPAGRREPR